MWQLNFFARSSDTDATTVGFKPGVYDSVALTAYPFISSSDVTHWVPTDPSNRRCGSYSTCRSLAYAGSYVTAYTYSAATTWTYLEVSGSYIGSV